MLLDCLCTQPLCSVLPRGSGSSKHHLRYPQGGHPLVFLSPDCPPPSRLHLRPPWWLTPQGHLMPTVQHCTWSCISSKCRPHSSGNAFLPVGYLSLSTEVLNERRAGQLLLPVELAVTITQKCGSASLGKQASILSKGMQKRRPVRR